MDGKEAWKVDCNERFGKIDIQFGLTSTPVLDGDAIYLQLLHGPMVRGNQERTGKVVKLNKATVKLFGNMIASPKPTSNANTRMLHR